MTMLTPIFDADLQPYNSFGFASRAARLLTLTQAEQLPALLADHGFRHGPRWILGGGSNVLLPPYLAGTVVLMSLKGIELLSEDDQQVKIRVAAGENWHEFVQYCLAQGWYGLENLSLIPGTVGAAPIQNIGAYGVEVRQWIETVEFIDLDNAQTHRLSAAACEFAYRDSVFKRQWRHRALITAVEFQLPKHPQPRYDYGDLKQVLQELGTITPQAVAQAVITVRQSKLPDPKQLGNAGSFFKNPLVDDATLQRLITAHPTLAHHGNKLAAGWLIDRAGLKGYRQGPVGVHEKQALVLVNYGGGSAADIMALAEHVQHTVATCYGVLLEREPDVMGNAV